MRMMQSRGFRRLLAAWILSWGLSAGAAPETPRPLLRDFIGINGHTVQFRPELYAPAARLVRDYHPVEWDLGTNTAALPPFPFAKNRVNWEHVYGAWRATGLTVNASLMFESIARTNWVDLESDARAYGRAFAREFGPSGARRLVESAEIGNEPGEWSDADYTRIFRAMAEGLREGDPKLRIVTCNLTTGPSGPYEKSVACLEGLSAMYDVLSVHTYAQLDGWPTWRRSFPEDPALEKYLPDIEALCRWRDAHAPGKPVWVTEFGYDSSTKTASGEGDFARWEGVTDTRQAQWLVRSLLVFSAMPVERAYVYFFNDDDEPKLHAAAGVTRHFQPKPSYHALAHLQRHLGAYRFGGILTNAPGRLRVQEYRHETDAKKFAWVVWSPTGNDRTDTAMLGRTSARFVEARRMPLTKDEADVISAQVRREDDGRWVVPVMESPVYLFFEEP